MLERTDCGYLESLSDEEFFSRRFVMDEADRAELLRNSVEIDGTRYYKAGVRERLLRKYASMTNPKAGEPGSKENPLTRFGKEYVYNELGDLVEYVRPVVRFVLRPNMRPSESQIRRALAASRQPIVYGEDCPELSEETIERFMKAGERRNRERREALV